MTECEKKELIRSLAMGISFEEISVIYEMPVTEVEAFYKENKAAVDAEKAFQKEKWGE
ncbi:MAG: hypothetical protein ACI4GX_08100 [Ruminococcus sp.]